LMRNSDLKAEPTLAVADKGRVLCSFHAASHLPRLNRPPRLGQWALRTDWTWTMNDVALPHISSLFP